MLFFSSTSSAFALPQINEFLVHPSSGLDEWVEIYNPDGVDLSSYWIDDKLSGGRPKKSLASLPSPTEKYAYVTFSSNYYYFNDDVSDINPDDVVLLGPDGASVLDSYHYTSDPGIGVIIGRTPDGGAWSVGIAATQGGPNSAASTPTPTPSPTPTPTPSPTPTPTPTPLPTPTSSPSLTPKPSTASVTSTKTPTPTPQPKATGVGAKLTDSSKKSSTDLVLGVQEGPTVESTESAASTTEESSQQDKKPFLAIGLIALGLVFLGIALLAFLRERSSGRIKDLDEKIS